MSSKAPKQTLVWGGVLILIGVLALVNQFVELSPWAWAAFLAAAGLGAFVLYLADRSDVPVLLAAYVLWSVAGLLAGVLSDFLQDEAVALYVLVVIALPFVAVFVRDRTQWWALIPAYAMLAGSGVIGLAEWALVSDELIIAYVMFAVATPFFVVYALDRKRWWALIPGGILALLGVLFGLFLPWLTSRDSITAESAVAIAGGLVLLVAGVWMLVRAFVRRDPSTRAKEPPAV